MKHPNDGIICFECTELIKPLWLYKIKIDELAQAPIHVVGYNLLTEHICKRCNKGLLGGELYFKDSTEHDRFVQVVSEALASKISKEIYCCGNCTGYTLEKHIYNVNQGEPYNLINEDRYGSFIASYLEDNDLPEHIIDMVSKLLVCQECGYGSPRYLYGDPKNYYRFDMWDKIYFEKEVEDFFGWDIIQFARKFEITISDYELEEFKELLKKQPMLGLTNESGKKLYDAIKQSFFSKEFVVLPNNKSLFRGRVRHQDEKPYLEHEFWSPPQGKATHGRYNTIGKSVLYCSDQKEVLAYELHPTNTQIIDIVSFEVNSELKLFDMDNAFEKFEGFIATPNSESNLLKQVYLFTNFIGSCCEEVGYDGVKYSGVGSVDLKYTNYALFENEKLRTILNIVGIVEQYRVKVTYENDRYREKSITEMLNLIK
ncbi:RES domain-containing protein [Paenibacillus sp. DMB5]|uniref:RES domain-containing protein n=1 Tax=Paenibacillus sp. DMB5 TaxID=1780103 RepID=UPI00076D3C9C|nr:RES domain-containing protein [Paenibacillus sp. DMB5]KUP21137.1 hypothetical protein AWJ19_08000 [Paenibacillus sp. DMB5]